MESWAVVAAGLATILGATIVSPPRPRLVWNVSESAPLGLYRVDDAPLVVGDMVAARVPAAWRTFASSRGYIPLNVPLIKRIAAGPGDRICVTASEVKVNGRRAAQRRATDGAGRAMPSWSGCLTLRSRQYLLLMDKGASFDGRYFGPSVADDIIGRAQLLWAR